MLGHDLIAAGSAKVVVTGGMESMSNAPYLMPKARSGYRMGHQEVLDHMFFDGLQNPYDGNMMGHFAELTADKYAFSREDQDAFAVESVTRARDAATRSLRERNRPVTVRTRKGKTIVTEDEGPRVARHRENSNSATCIQKRRHRDRRKFILNIGRSCQPGPYARERCQEQETDILARIAGHSGFAHEPEWFTTAPVFAIKTLQQKLGWNADSVALYEINEAFACVTMAAMRDVGIEHAKVNVNGGACALGHPIGASGARIIVTLVHALRNRGGGQGVASLCIGGGEAVAIGIEVDQKNRSTQ